MPIHTPSPLGDIHVLSVCGCVDASLFYGTWPSKGDYMRLILFVYEQFSGLKIYFHKSKGKDYLLPVDRARPSAGSMVVRSCVDQTVDSVPASAEAAFIFLQLTCCFRSWYWITIGVFRGSSGWEGKRLDLGFFMQHPPWCKKKLCNISYVAEHFL